MRIQGHDIGVCSWSLRPKSAEDLVATVQSLGLSQLQLAVGSLLAMEGDSQKREREVLRKSGLQISSTMINFVGEDYSTIARIHETGGYLADETWPLRKLVTEQASQVSAGLGVKLLTTHIGFVPARGSARYAVMLERIGQITQSLAKDGITLLLETGQEKAASLLEFLEDVDADNLGVNFDPANMILYGAGDPIEAVGVLAKFIRQVHVKDAVASNRPGEAWGDEVAFGTGQVGPERLLTALHRAGYCGPLLIEREAGEIRTIDVKAAIIALQAI